MIALLRTLLFLSLAIAGTAHAQNPADAPETAEEHVRISLIPERNTVQPGDVIWVLIEQDIEPHWHTYWTNPGDSGAAPRITWTLPDGITTGEIKWPVPNRIPYAGLMNYGYEGKVSLLQEIYFPDSLPDGEIELKADIEILVCRDICIPEFKSVALTLNKPGVPAEDSGSAVDAAFNALPSEFNWTATYSVEGTSLAINIESDFIGVWNGVAPDSFTLFPVEWGIVKNAAPLQASITGPQGLKLIQERDDRKLEEINALPFVLSYTGKDGVRSGMLLVARPDAAKNSSPLAKPKESRQAKDNGSPAGLFQAVLFAVLGGIILNLMPCVFPVLSLKAVSLVQLREKGSGAAAQSGILYTAGILTCFFLIGGAILLLRASGETLGWGFQLQNPLMVLALSYLLFVIGLNLSGLFDIGGSFMNAGSKLTQKTGWKGSYFTGVLAAVVATPCTAPFMAGALGYALTQPAPVAMGIFMALGSGLALPYLIIATIPACARILPRPGAWMVKFREFLAFPMYASAAWLVWVLAQQVGASGILWALSGMVSIAFSLWLMMHRPEQKIARIAIMVVAFLAVLFAVMPFLDKSVLGIPMSAMEQDAPAPEKFSRAILEGALKSDQPVFTYMTAAWCITCKVNERAALNTEHTRRIIRERNIRVLKGDWTTMNPEITEYLKSYGRSGVPLYVYYGPPAADGRRPEPEVLPQILTEGLVAEAFQ